MDVLRYNRVYRKSKNLDLEIVTKVRFLLFFLCFYGILKDIRCDNFILNLIDS